MTGAIVEQCIAEGDPNAVNMHYTRCLFLLDRWYHSTVYKPLAI